MALSGTNNPYPKALEITNRFVQEDLESRRKLPSIWSERCHGLNSD